MNVTSDTLSTRKTKLKKDLKWQVSQYKRIYDATNRLSARFAYWRAKSRLARLSGDTRGMGEASRALKSITPTVLRAGLGV